MSFQPEEALVLGDLERDLRRVVEWPLDSPLAFVIHLAPRTRGKVGELLISRLAVSLGLQCAASGSADFDLLIGRPSGRVRTEIKFSTEDPPRFQQVRNPRRPDDISTTTWFAWPGDQRASSIGCSMLRTWRTISTLGSSLSSTRTVIRTGFAPFESLRTHSRYIA